MKLKKKLKEVKDWDWDSKEDEWIDKIDISIGESGAYNITYPNGRKVEFNFISVTGGIMPISREMLMQYYTGPTKVTMDFRNSLGSVYAPTPSPGSFALPTPNPIPVLP